MSVGFAAILRSRHIPVKFSYFEIKERVLPESSCALSFERKIHGFGTRVLRLDDIPPLITVRVTEHLPLSVQSRQMAVRPKLGSKIGETTWHTVSGGASHGSP